MGGTGPTVVIYPSCSFFFQCHVCLPEAHWSPQPTQPKMAVRCPFLPSPCHQQQHHRHSPRSPFGLSIWRHQCKQHQSNHIEPWNKTRFKQRTRPCRCTSIHIYRSKTKIQLPNWIIPFRRFSKSANPLERAPRNWTRNHPWPSLLSPRGPWYSSRCSWNSVWTKK